MTTAIETTIATKTEHEIPGVLLEKKVQVAVVGCGGTGSAIAAGLPHLHQAMVASGHPHGLDVTLVDGDRISRTNCVRQPFSESEIGLPKATVLATRINLFWGLGWKGVPNFVDESWGHETDILIGCVDSRAARNAMTRTQTYWNCHYWPDLGNNADSGQFVLEDIEANKVDTIVVYKVDRLTRSLADFAKIVEALDARGVSFVSVTQQFNTTTSMGRLTLNILLSFAQFEREVTGERIRDKIAASKRKGMWMGGTVPLGYDVKDRKLVVNPDDARMVVRLFNLYLELGCVSKLKARLDQEGIKSKTRTSVAGNRSGGTSYCRGALYQILKNRIYLGEIPHRGQNHPGEHAAIVPRKLWDRGRLSLRVITRVAGMVSKRTLPVYLSACYRMQRVIDSLRAIRRSTEDAIATTLVKPRVTEGKPEK